MNVPGWSEDMMKSWAEAQQKYWSNLMSVHGATGAGSANMSDWSEGIEQWWTMVTPRMPVQASDLMRRVFEMGQAYARLAEASAAAGSGSEYKSALDGWMAAMEKSFNGESLQGAAGFLDSGVGRQLIEGWQQVMDRCGMGALKDMPVMEGVLPGSELWQAQMKSLSGLPGFADSISQDSQYKLAELTASYQQALQNYMAAFSGQGADAMQVLRERLAQLASEGATITSLRELYDLWVDVSEEVYHQFAMSDHYQRLYGEMINSFVALKGGIDTVRDAQLQALRALTVGADGADNAGHEPAAEKPATKPKPAAEAKKPAVKADAKTDNLMRIKGIGPKMQEKLMDAGIQTFDQLAALSDDQVHELDKQLDAHGRLVREDWVAQANEMSRNKLV